MRQAEALGMTTEEYVFFNIDLNVGWVTEYHILECSNGHHK